NEVVGTDINENTVHMLENGEIPFEEKGINELYENAVENNIKFTTTYQKTDMYIITVPTPYIHSSKKVDPKYIKSAVNSVLDVCNTGAIIIVESTVSPGTMNRHVVPIIE